MDRPGNLTSLCLGARRFFPRRENSHRLLGGRRGGGAGYARSLVLAAAALLSCSQQLPSPEQARVATRAVAPFDATAAAAYQAACARELDVPVEVTHAIGMRLRLIPPGEFSQGSPESEPERWEAEGPLRRVRITRPFYLGVSEVTQRQFQHVMGYNPSFFSEDAGGQAEESDDGDLPVERVTWDEAVAFCRRLSEFPEERAAGWHYRLPTEAEWEYACRAGTTTPFHFGSQLNGIQANCNGDYPYGTRDAGPSRGQTVPVGSYPPNPFGLYDMHGNVWEWVADWYDAAYYARAPQADPPGPRTGHARTRRGGGWLSLATRCRAANRDHNEPQTRYEDLGFRVARVRREP